MAAALPLSANAACRDDAEVVRVQFASVHDTLSEADHSQTEAALGKAYSLCSMGQDADAAAQLAEAQAVLARYLPPPATAN